MATKAGIHINNKLFAYVWHDGYITNGVGDVLLTSFTTLESLDLIKNKLNLTGVYFKKDFDKPEIKFTKDHHILYTPYKDVDYIVDYIAFGDDLAGLREKFSYKEPSTKWLIAEKHDIKLCKFNQADYNYHFNFIDNQWYLYLDDFDIHEDLKPLVKKLYLKGKMCDFLLLTDIKSFCVTHEKEYEILNQTLFNNRVF